MCTFSREELEAAEIARIEAFEANEGVKILQCTREDEKIVPTLINGKQVDRAKWLEVVRIGNRSCTATLVGKNCAISAAHCGKNNSFSNVEVYQGPTVRCRVVHHPRYRNSGSNFDLAILVLEQDVDVPFASVGIDHVFRNGQDVDIAGYGCTQPGGRGGNDGILRWGESRVVGMTGTDVVTQWRPGGAALCFGDSGGPMFADGSPDGNRTLIAVNSKGNIRDTNYNMRLDLESVKDWLNDMANSYNLDIQGLTTPKPQPDAPTPDPGDSQPVPPSTLVKLMAERDSEFAALHEKWRDKLDSGHQGCEPDCGDGKPKESPTFGL